VAKGDGSSKGSLYLIREIWAKVRGGEDNLAKTSLTGGSFESQKKKSRDPSSLTGGPGVPRKKKLNITGNDAFFRN